MPRARAVAAPVGKPGPVAAPTNPRLARPLRLADAGLVALLLALSALLGAFPLRDTDFWWHLRTGDLIRATGRVPRLDWYTYTVPEAPWIDLHWGFQVLISLGHAAGGVPLLNLAKCAITATAVGLLVLTRRRGWPVWAMTLAWTLPVLVLGGREYVRPETLTLLYLAADLALLARIGDRPRLAFLIPAVQILWVNTQGLFILGPIVVAFALIDAALRPGAFGADRRAWWKTVGPAASLTGLACLASPYGIAGALFPLQLASTMRDPIFSRYIAELTPIEKFIRDHGFSNRSLQLQGIVFLLGVLSFLAPIVWRIVARSPVAPAPKAASQAGTRSKPRGKLKATKSGAVPSRDRGRPAVPVFRLLLFASFGYLGLQATRNSHQFAAIFGAITAWNVGEWGADVAARRAERGVLTAGSRGPLAARAIAAAVLGTLIAAVGSGAYYNVLGEKRTVGLGEESLWFAHGAAKFVAGPGMPRRNVSFHNGLAALFDYYGGPDRKTYADARLEVIGPDLFRDYIALQGAIGADAPGWEQRLEPGGWPSILVDHVQGETASVGSTLFRNPRWRCVWFDPIASAFLRVEDARAAGAPAVDFDARHFRGDPAGPADPASLIASAWALRNQAGALIESTNQRPRRDLAEPMIRLAIGQARRAVAARPGSVEAWRLLGQLESFRNPASAAGPSPRFRSPFDPVFDLPMAKSTHDLLRAAEIGADISTIAALAMGFGQRGMIEAALPWSERLAAIEPTNEGQRIIRRQSAEAVRGMRGAMGPPTPATFRNTEEFGRQVDGLLDHGRAASAADLIERGSPNPAGRPWAITDRLATLRLHLGRADLARAAWSAAVDPPRPAVRDARVAASLLVEGRADEARAAYRRAIAAEPDLFEAHYGLAILEADAAHAGAALTAAEAAIRAAPGDAARNAARSIADAARPFAVGR